MKDFINKLKCKLGFHDFRFESADERFMPKVRVLLGKCLTCPARQDFFQFFDSRKVVVKNHGLSRILGEYIVMPLNEKVENK